MIDKFSQKNNVTPLNNNDLRSLALNYVGKYATTRKKLTHYLSRKIKERGWDDQASPNIEQLVQEFSNLGYVNDSLFAASKARSLINRGYGLKRLEQDIFINGIEGSDQEEALALLKENRWKSAENFARKKHIGPYAKQKIPKDKKQKQLSAFLRAGHEMKIAQKYVNADPDDIIDWTNHDID